MSSPITPEVIYHLITVGDPSLSPDGSQVAFTCSKVDWANMESPSQVMLMALPDGEAVPFTAGPKDSAPKFSPDGETLGFLREDVKRCRQLWLIPTSGGEARQLSSMPGGVSEFAWAPDSSALVFISDVDPDRPADDHDPKTDPRVRVVHRIKYQADTIGWRGDAHWHLFVIDAGGGGTRQLTDGDWDDLTPVWSPDGTRIAFISYRQDDRDLVLYSEAYVVAAAGGEPELWSQGLSTVAAIAWSPEGDRLAVIASDNEKIGAAWQGALFVLAPGQPPRRITPDAIKPVAGMAPVTPPPDFRWAPDGRILFIGDGRGESHLWEIRESTGELRQVAGGDAQFATAAMDPDGARAVVIASTPSSAGDLHLVEAKSGSMKQLTQYNSGYFQEHPMARMEKFVLTRGGLEIECRLLFPPDFDSARRYPLVLDIHGGPHGVFYDAFNATQQVLATAGYLVLLVNPRGSSTYGVDFAKAVLRDWGGEDYLDIIDAVQEVSAREYVDSSRLGVHGYSYGGYMTSWIVGHDTRFGAAVAGAPCINLNSMYGTSDIGVSFGEQQWGGMRHEAEDAFHKRSPLTYASSVKTPVLLLHGEADHRCPIEQSEQYFVALKRLGKEVEFVRFPNCSHLFLRSGHPRMREEYLARTLAWFDRLVGRGEAAASAPEATTAGKALPAGGN